MIKRIMLIVTFQINAFPGTEMDIKEALAMQCEPLGAVTFPAIEYISSAMVLTTHINAPDGSVTAFNKLIRPYLNQYRDTLVLGVREVLPQQLGF